MKNNFKLHAPHSKLPIPNSQFKTMSAFLNARNAMAAKRQMVFQSVRISLWFPESEYFRKPENQAVLPDNWHRIEQEGKSYWVCDSFGLVVPFIPETSDDRGVRTERTGCNSITCPIEHFPPHITNEDWESCMVRIVFYGEIEPRAFRMLHPPFPDNAGKYKIQVIDEQNVYVQYPANPRENPGRSRRQ